MEGDVDFVAVDNPHANRLMIHLLAAFAEHERELISTRTKAALQAAAKRGVELGRNGKFLAVEYRRQAFARAEIMRPIIRDLTSAGHVSASDMAQRLNELGYRGPNGGMWYATSVRRLITRISDTEIYDITSCSCN
jgi:DNA invertase Pin-like site-specific DNA recombinase